MMESRLVGSPSRNVFDPGKSLGVHERNWKKEWRMEKKVSVLKWKLSKNDLWSWGYFFLWVGSSHSTSALLFFLFFYNRNIIFRQKFFDPQMWIQGKVSIFYTIRISYLARYASNTVYVYLWCKIYYTEERKYPTNSNV